MIFKPRLHGICQVSNHNGWDNWQAQIIPNYDFNGDGQVDDKDVLVMKDHWGQNYPLCDIGPFAWGDGVVDGQDLMVLMETVEGSGFVLNPSQHSSHVPCDVILSWTSPKFANTHDVYFGTSFEDVSTADRNNPKDVLVSQDQTNTTYDHPVLLEFEQTYYWRIDEVGAAPDFTIYRGSVLDFTTETYAYPKLWQYQLSNRRCCIFPSRFSLVAYSQSDRGSLGESF